MDYVQSIGSNIYHHAKNKYYLRNVASTTTIIGLTVGLSLPAIGYTVALYMLNLEISKRFPTPIICGTIYAEQQVASKKNKKMTYYAVTGSALLLSGSPALTMLGLIQIKYLLYDFCGSHLEVTDGEPNLNFCKRSLSTIIDVSPNIYAFGLNPATFTGITIYKTVHHILPKKNLSSSASALQRQAVIAHNNKIYLLKNSIFLALGFIANPTLFALVVLSLSDIATTLTDKLHDYATQDSQ